MRTHRALFFGNKAKYNHWGKRGCSHGMYSRGGHDYYIYGIRGLFNYVVDKQWGCYISKEIRYK